MEDQRLIDDKYTRIGFDFTVAVLMNVFFSLVFTFFSVIADAVNGDVDFYTTDLYKIVGYTLGGVLVFFTVLICCTKDKRNYFKTLKKFKISSGYIFPIVLITLGFMFGLSEVNTLFVSFLEKIGLKVSTTELPDYSPLNLIICIVGICAVPAIMEEMLFREIMCGGLKIFGVKTVVILSGIFFSLFHMSPAQTVYQFIVGCLYAYIAFKTESLYPTIISHFVNNLFVILNYYFIDIELSVVLRVIITVVGLICLLLGVFIMYKVSLKNVKTEKGIKMYPESKGLKKVVIFAIPGILMALFMWIMRLF